jgi:hypothetical protein
MQVFAAFRSVPDYHAGPAPFVSVHETLGGAIKALYPDNVKYQEAFRKWANSRMDTWEGPDGFGLVRKIEVLP